MRVGKTIVVSGATGGVGRGVALACAEAGWTVWIAAEIESDLTPVIGVRRSGVLASLNEQQREHDALLLWGLRERLKVLDAHVSKRDWLIGDRFTVADLNVAAPLALGWRRSHRSYGLVIGCVVLIGYNEVLRFGERSVAHVGLDPILGLWLPLVVLLIGTGAFFYKAAFRAGRPLGLRSLTRAFGYTRPSLPAPRQLDAQNQ